MRDNKQEAMIKSKPPVCGARRCATALVAFALTSVVLLLIACAVQHHPCTHLRVYCNKSDSSTNRTSRSSRSASPFEALFSEFKSMYSQNDATSATNFTALPSSSRANSDAWLVEPAAVSARGALAFWLASSGEPALAAHNNAIVQTTAYAVRSHQQQQQHRVCGQRARPTSKTEPHVELIVVEGRPLALNLVIIGQRLAWPKQQQQQHRHPTLGVRAHWSKVSHEGTQSASRRWRFSVVEDAHASRFGSHARNLATAPSSLVWLAAAAGASNVSSVFADELASAEQSKDALQQDGAQFMLPPFAASTLADDVKRQRPSVGGTARAIEHALAAAAQHSTQLVDDFVGEARQVDWRKLDAYVRYNARPLQLHLGGGGGAATQQDSATQQSQDDTQTCATASGEPDALIVAQAELGLVEPDDRGTYTLQVCALAGVSNTDISDAQQGRCEQLSVRVHVIDDVPQLERADETSQETLLLSVGERMSIKCEAHGHTLPQITWFLDGQQLNEHASPHTTGAQQTATATSNQQQQLQQHILATRLRIGDYVSQDGRVHSFVNASSVQLHDGGSYRCVANNGRHQIERTVRVDVRGPPIVARRLPVNMSVLANQHQTHLNCPYSGWPVGAIEWYYKPRIAAASNKRRRQAADFTDGRAPEQDVASLFGNTPTHTIDPAHDQDEWLAQANDMTPPSPADYPEPPPDYPSGGLISAVYDDAIVYDDADAVDDYADEPVDRRRRDSGGGGGALQDDDWLKLPQSRRHQLHSNGTLVIVDVQRADQGLYKCRVLAPSARASSASEDLANAAETHPHPQQQQQQQQQQLPWSSSNELQLNVMVAPVIAPIAAADTLREDMRSSLFCSVVEGDAPVRFRWLKDGEPIESYAARTPTKTSGELRVRVDSSTEFVSTLHFSQVSHDDTGLYTCVATNDAASVNYTTRMLVNVAPKWLRAPKDVECVAGQSIVIDCQAHAHPAPRVWWEIGSYAAPARAAAAAQAPDVLQPPNHYRTIISNSRIHILENASLVIRDVTKSDQGYYLCQAANNFGSLSALIRLTVNVGASFANKYLIKHVKLAERVELDCEPSGQSPIDITWSMRPPGSTAIQQQQQSAPANPNQLELAHATTTQSPLHSANASSSGLGRPLFVGTIRTELPVAEFAAAAPATRAGEQVSIGAPGEPSHSVDVHFEVHRRAVTGDLASELVRMVITRAARHLSADYVCAAQNKFGRDERLIRLLVQEPPDAVREASVVQLDSRSAMLVWPAPFAGHAPITSYSIEWAPIGGGAESPSPPPRWTRLTVQQPSALLQNLEPLTSYEVRVRAHNQLGASPLHAAAVPTAVLTTREEAPNTPPLDVRARPLSSSSVQVSWLPPAHSRHAPLKGYYLGYRPLAGAQSAAQNASEPYVFKTIAWPADADAASDADAAADQPQLPTPQTLLAADTNVTSTAAAATTATTAPTTQHKRIKVVVGELRRSTRYAIIVQAFNGAGPGPQSDIVETRTLANDPPPAPALRVGLSTYTSVEMLWSMQLSQQQQQHPAQPAAPDGYHLYYRAASGGGGGGHDDAQQQQQQPQWRERRLAPETHNMIAYSQLARNELTVVEAPPSENLALSDRLAAWHRNSTMALQHGDQTQQVSFRYALDQLSCGHAYQVYLVAYNSVGAGAPSQIVRAKARGSPPIAPRKYDFLVINSTRVQLQLDAWLDGGCAITNIEIKYKQVPRSVAFAHATKSRAQSEPSDADAGWLLLSNIVSPEQRLLELRDLQPETVYAILAIAESQAGRTEQRYVFMTLDKLGQTPEDAAALDALTAAAHSASPSTQNTLPALISRSNKSLLSFLHNLQANGDSSSSSLLTLVPGIAALLLLITCLLVLVRVDWRNVGHATYKHNQQDNASIGSHQTSVAASTMYGGDQPHGLMQQQQHYLHHHRLAESADNYAANMSSLGCGASANYGVARKLESAYASRQQQQQQQSSALDASVYAFKVSPCKTNTTSLTGDSALSSAGTQSSTAEHVFATADAHASPAKQIAFGDGAQQPTLDLSHLLTSGNSSLYPQQQQQQEQNNCCANEAQKGATLARDAASAAVCADRFRTMPHPGGSRPVSTFLPQRIYGQCSGVAANASVCEQLQRQQHQQHIYSKLQHLCKSRSNYNMCAGADVNGNCVAQQQPQAVSELASLLAECQRQELEEQQQRARLNGDYVRFNVDLSAQPLYAKQHHIEDICDTSGTNGTASFAQPLCTANSNEDQSQQQQLAQPNQEQISDYALPFPPKWV